jgi:outer membrane immunogenic protein
MFVAQGALAAEWTGFYIGANVGGTFGDVDLEGVSEDTDYVNISSGDVFNFSADGVLGGAQLGYNFEMSGWLFGLEVEGHGMDFDTAEAVNAEGDIVSIESEWGATATARLGFILNANSLLYVKGGYATGNINTSYLDTVGTPNTTGLLETDETHHGWVVGAGFEHAIGEHTSFGVEYNYIDLGETDHSGIASGTGGGLVVYNIDAQLHTVTARLNYHFNPF